MPRPTRIAHRIRNTVTLTALAGAFLLAAPARSTPPIDAVDAPSIHFERGSARLLPAGRAELARIARVMRADPAIRIEVLGFADDSASVTHDQELSYQRARAVARALASLGVPITEIYATGLGQLQPVAAGSSAPAAALNRRVEIRLTGPEVAIRLGSALRPEVR